MPPGWAMMEHIQSRADMVWFKMGMLMKTHLEVLEEMVELCVTQGKPNEVTQRAVDFLTLI